jgi:type IV secretion system protein VirD4
MTPTKFLIGQILIVFAIVVLGVWAATQWAAAQLAYQPQLGPAWFVLGRLPLYRPWALFGWWYHYEAYAPGVFNPAGALAAASGFLGCFAAVAGSLWRARQTGLVTTYGSARWAEPREMRHRSCRRWPARPAGGAPMGGVHALICRRSRPEGAVR